MDVDLLVAADDRTGAFESAAALADHGAGPVRVTAWRARAAFEYRPSPVRDDELTVEVIDLGSRHAIPAEAAARAAALPTASRIAHKIDSTLRGNWSEELAARSASGPVLLIPALPAFGRSCVDGMVLERGRPVHEGSAGSDVRRRVVTSRPVDMVRAAGLADVGLLADHAAVVEWLADPAGVRVANAADDRDITALVGEWGRAARLRPDVLLAGTSAVIGAAADVLGARRPTAALPPIVGPILVVCGSVHPAARAQLGVAERSGLPVVHLADDLAIGVLQTSGVLVLASEIPVGDVADPMAVAAAATLARGVTAVTEHVDLGALIILGGDTAAAVLGDSLVEVYGSVDIGTAWARLDRFGQPVITRSGGFGSDNALVDLVRSMLGR